jgi:hypothetical protein
MRWMITFSNVTSWQRRKAGKMGIRTYQYFSVMVDTGFISHTLMVGTETEFWLECSYAFKRHLKNEQ